MTQFMAVRDILLGVGMVFVIEGLLFAAFPGAMRKAIEQTLAMPETPLRIVALVVAAVGLSLIWLLRP